MSKYTFIDEHGDEQPMPSDLDNDEAQFNRGFLGGLLNHDEVWGYRPVGASHSKKHIAHDLKCEAFKRGWEAGYKRGEDDWMAWERKERKSE